jgi:F0F1-type ATP synthase membrane subunit c/vacuolar-type H+-ATPase subunit K
MGDAELSIWAIPSGASRKLYTGLIVIIALLAALALIRNWPESAARQPMSLNRTIIYGVVLVVFALVLGLLGLLISIVTIVLIETARAVSASRPAAA